MSDLKVEGKIYKIFDAQQVTATFTKREFVVITDENYPQHVKFELIQDRCNLVDGYAVDQEVTVHFNVRGREWSPQDGGDAKYFISLNAWRIEKKADAPQAPANDAPFPSAEPPAEEIGDDLPF